MNMPIIEYQLNDDNQSQVAKRIAEDWNINTFNIDQSQEIELLKLIEDKCQMVYSNIDDTYEENINIYTDICIQPINLLYNALPLKNVSLTISMNEIKAFVAEVVFMIIATRGINPQNNGFIELTEIIIRLLVLVSSNLHIIKNHMQKCVLKAMFIVSSKGQAPKREILEIFDEDFLCPHKIKKCEYLNCETQKCILNKENRLSKINDAINQLIEDRVIIQKETEDKDNPVYRISNFVEKNEA